MNDPLPPGVTRSSDILGHVTLDNCEAIMLWFGALRCRVVWKGRNRNVRPLTKHRIRDLRPGDHVSVGGREEQVTAVEVYR